jgi:multidrug resistance efflux pump
MSSALANRLRLTRYLRLDYLEHLMFSAIVLFLLALVLIMRFVPVTDYLDGVTGRISSASPPLKILSDGQYRIDKVHVRRDQYVRKGDILIEFAREALDAELQATDAEIAGNGRELSFRQIEIATGGEKIALNEHIIADKERLKRIVDEKNEAVIKIDAERRTTTEKIRAASDKLLNRILPRIDDPMFSSLDRMKILSNAHAELRQMQDLTTQMQNNTYLPEETRRRAAIEASILRKENADLRLARADAERAVHAIENAVARLRIKRVKLASDLARTRVLAPADGCIVDISPGIAQANLVKDNEEMFAIHDQASPLEAELVLTDEQFRDARVGQRVNMELYAWTHYKHGVIPGRIVAISRTKVMPIMAPSKSAAFVAKVRIPSRSMADVKMGFDLKARVVLGDITLFDYLLKKLNLT